MLSEVENKMNWLNLTDRRFNQITFWVVSEKPHHPSSLSPLPQSKLCLSVCLWALSQMDSWETFYQYVKKKKIHWFLVMLCCVHTVTVIIYSGAGNVESKTIFFKSTFTSSAPFFQLLHAGKGLILLEILKGKHFLSWLIFVFSCFWCLFFTRSIMSSLFSTFCCSTLTTSSTC